MHAIETAAPATTDRSICGLPVDADVLFSDKDGVRRKSVQNKKLKLLQKLAFLRKFLAPDERIVFVTTGCSPFSAVEQMTIGHAWVYLIKRALFVFTNKRILHVPTTMSYEYRGSLAQILYQDCRAQYVKGSAFFVECHSGKKEKFYGIPRADRAMIRRLNIEAGEFGPRSARPERNFLCPQCASVLTPEQYACPSCNLEFKNKAEALKYSLLAPGGGYFYTRHWGLGILDAMAESYLLLLTAVAFLAAALGDPEALPAVVILSVILGFEKLITVYHSNHFIAEFLPKNLKLLLTAPMEPLPQAQPAAAPPDPQKESIERVLSLR
ncbi:MAG: hypothetical protein JW741_12720 [Sedimentisphaerales bacterium]|nr:hypothetical protein [Sedimentisphaerales bacterium]